VVVQIVKVIVQMPAHVVMVVFVGVFMGMVLLVPVAVS
jgi:hypothetical protein